MSMTDPIADMLTRIRNAIHRKHEMVEVPASRLKLEVIKIFEEEGLIQRYELVDRNSHKMIRIHLKYAGGKQPVIRGLQRISKPGRRIYVGKDAVPTVRGGLGLAIVSTSQGVVTDRESKRRKIGGEVLCYVW